MTMNKLLESLVDLKEISYDKQFNKASKLHKYWSRKPWYIVEQYIEEYSKAGDLVLDPFCGSGAIGLECVLNGRNFVGYDLNPMAAYLTENTLAVDFESSDFLDEADELENTVKAKIMELYALENGSYILYSIRGENTKSYNTVTADYSFRKKGQIQLDFAAHDARLNIPKTISVPDKAFPKKFYKDRFSYKGVKKVSDMFSRRNLYALSILYDAIQAMDLKYKDLFLLAFTNTLLHVSKLKGENVRPLGVNNYWIPNDFIEENVMWRFSDRVLNTRIAKETILKRKRSKKRPEGSVSTVYNKSSVGLDEIVSGSVDYLFTDPPYGETIQYSELSFMWNCWLEREYEILDEVIINPVQNKGISEFQKQISVFIENAYRVLKPNAFFTLSFQNKDVKIWLDIVQSIKNAGFSLYDIKIYDTFGSPYNKHWAKFSPKSDLYVTFKKTRSKKIVPSRELSPEEITQKILALFNRNPDLEFDLHKGYDLFVAAVISEVFNGKSVEHLEKWSLKKILELFELTKNDGVKQVHRAEYFQPQLSF